MSYTFTTPALGGRIVFADEKYEMNEAGEERVAFTDAEFAIMMSDPSFGYVGHCGHVLDRVFAAYEGGCRTCFNLAEENCEYDEDDAKALAEAEAARAAAPAPAAPDFSPDDAPF